MTSGQLPKSNECLSAVPASLVKPDFNAVLPGFLRLFLPFALITTLIVLGFYQYEGAKQRNIKVTTLQNSVGHVVSDLELIFGTIVSDLRYLSELRGIRRLADGDYSAESELASDLLFFSLQKGNFDQVRFIDTQGKERVRINYNRGHPTVVPEEELQNKKGRYYFDDTLKLSRNEIFVSPLDLNIERGEIEFPLKPMIRFGIPVFRSDGSKGGIVLLNFLAERLLNYLDEIARESGGEISLLNKEGYWLAGAQDEDEWGFMYPERKSLTLGNRYPEVWARIQAKESGVANADDGSYFFSTVQPIKPELDSSDGAGLKYFSGHGELGPDNYYWKVVAYYPSELLTDPTYYSVLFVLYILSLLGIALGTWFRSRAICQTELTVNELEKRGRELESLVEARTRELSQSYGQLELMLASTGVGIIGANDRGLCTFVNRGALDILGYRDEGDVVGHDLHELIHHHHEDGSVYEVDECPVHRASKQGEAIFLDDEVLWRADDTPFSAEFRSYPMMSGDDVVGTVISFNDITEHKHAEEALRRAQKMDAVGQLTGGIAHDFNNILSIVQGNLDLLERQIEVDEKTSKRIATIKKSTQRAVDLTKQLLGFSRRQPAQKMVTNINELIEGMDSLIARSVTPEVKVEHHLANNLWSTEIDPGDFEDALLNLILNSRDAIEGGGYIMLGTANITLNEAYCAQNPGVEPGDYVQLLVRDTGKGIPPEVQGNIFEPFFTTKERGKGTGLGMAMVYGFVQRSGGHIRLHSESDIGTTLRIYLPRAAEQSDVKEHSESVMGKQEELMTGGNALILAVDDEEGLLELARERLEMLGYEVVTAADGVEAMEQLAKHPSISLLFSDVVMPGGMNGYELAELATAMHPDLRVLLTSGYTEKGTINDATKRLKYNLLPKPYNQGEMARRVQEVMATPRHGKEFTSAHINYVEWTNELSVDIDEIDSDHQVLVELLNHAKEATAWGDIAQCEDILVRLQDYTESHFRREEAVMEACEYPDVDDHIKVHRLLTGEVKGMLIQYEQGELTATDLTAFLTGWLVDHIQNMDHAFASYCKGKDKEVAQALKGAGPAPGERLS